MLYSEIIAVCSQIHTKHINKLRGQNVELLNVKLAVHIVTTLGRLPLSVSHTYIMCLPYALWNAAGLGMFSVRLCSVVFVVVRHAKPTRGLIDIAASYFADSICQAKIVLGLMAWIIWSSDFTAPLHLWSTLCVCTSCLFLWKVNVS
jgi:hypothetical protein